MTMATAWSQAFETSKSRFTILVFRRAIVYTKPRFRFREAKGSRKSTQRRSARERTIKSLEARNDQIQARIKAMYQDKLDGRISQQFFDENAAGWRHEQANLLRKIRDIRAAALAPSAAYRPCA